MRSLSALSCLFILDPLLESRLRALYSDFFPPQRFAAACFACLSVSLASPFWSAAGSCNCWTGLMPRFLSEAQPPSIWHPGLRYCELIAVADEALRQDVDVLARMPYSSLVVHLPTVFAHPGYGFPRQIRMSCPLQAACRNICTRGVLTLDAHACSSFEILTASVPGGGEPFPVEVQLRRHLSTPWLLSLVVLLTKSRVTL